MEVEPRIIEIINAIWLSPYGVAAKIIFISGGLLMLVLMIYRHKMSIADAALALVGFKPVSNRDIWFNLVHFLTIAIPVGLLALAVQGHNS